MMDTKAEIFEAALVALTAALQEKPARGPKRTDPGSARFQKSQRVNLEKQKRKPHPKQKGAR
jgi:hypothetical protein